MSEEPADGPGGAPMVRVEADRGVATVFLDNPAGRNGWNLAMEAEYFDTLDRLDTDPSTRAIVVTGAGRTFCPGLDITALQATSATGGGLDRTGRRPMHHALGIGKPMIAAINGACAGVGLMQALCCDLRFVSRTARLSTAYSRRGLPAEYGMAWMLTRIMRLDQALDILLSARTIEAEEAFQLGLVTRLTEPEDLLRAAQAYAMDMAENCSPRSLKAIRYQTHADLSRRLIDAVDDGMELMAWFNSAENPDFAEGVASFRARRPPRFAPLPEGFSLAQARRAATGHVPESRTWL
jgi:enoyl-CoA hydratase/carnithine racemase